MSVQNLKRQNSLECTCELNKLSSISINKKCNYKCDFCSEHSFIKSLRNKSRRKLSLLTN